MPLQHYFSYNVAVSFYLRGKPELPENTQTCRKLVTNLITQRSIGWESN